MALFLPDRHFCLDAIGAFFGRAEGIAAVRGGRNYGKGQVADLKIPRAVSGPEAHRMAGGDGVGDVLASLARKGGRYRKEG